MDQDTISTFAAAATAFVTALALIAVSSQAWLLKRQLSQDHRWRRREKALLFSQVNHPDVREARARLSSKLGVLQTRIPWTDLQNKIAADPSIHDDMYTILIYIENLGLAIRHNVADFMIVYDMNGTEIIGFYDVYREYIDQTRQGNRRIWQNVEYLANRLSTELERRNIAESKLYASEPTG